MYRKAALVFLAGLFLITGGHALGQENRDSKQVVAVVSGVKLTVADLEQKEGAKLLQARYQYYMNQRRALDQLIDDKLLEIEAAKQHISLEDLLATQVYKNVKDPTEDQLQVYYEGLDSSDAYESVREKVLEHIRELRRTKARAAYVAALRNNANPIVLLAPPAAEVNLQNTYIQGDKTAPVTLIEFADYECPYCQKITPDLQKLEKEYGSRLAIAYKDFPLPMHHTSEKAAEAARCAGEQGKFWEYHDVLFYSKQLGIPDLKEHARVLKLDGERFDKCLDDGAETAAVKKDLEEAQHFGLTGTPSFFVNGHFFSGAADYTILREMVEQQMPVASRSVATEASRKAPEEPQDRNIAAPAVR